MNKFSEAIASEQDNRRVRSIREREAGKIERQFGPVKRKAQANADAMLRPVKQGEMRVAIA
jgi:hypothetical protein